MPEGFHSATSFVETNALFQLYTDRSEIDDCMNVLGFALETWGDKPLSDKQLKKIADDSAEIARKLLKEQVYEAGYSDNQTYRLLNSIKAETRRNDVVVYSDARSPKGYPYAGSIEYGFHPYGHDNFIPPRPFLRPALEFATNATRASWEANVKHMAEALRTNNLQLSHFDYAMQDIGASRRTWGQNITSHINSSSMSHFSRKTSEGISRGHYSHENNSLRYGTQKGAYKSIWDIE